MGWNPISAASSFVKAATNPNEYKKAWDTTLNAAKKIDPSTAGHLALDVVGLVPVVGEAADLANAGWYLAEGDKTNAALSAAAAVPGLGYVAAGTKAGKAAIKGAKALSDSTGATKAASKTVSAVTSSKVVTNAKTATTAVTNSKVVTGAKKAVSAASNSRAASVVKTVANKTGAVKVAQGYAALDARLTNKAINTVDKVTGGVGAGARAAVNTVTGGPARTATATATRTAGDAVPPQRAPGQGGGVGGNGAPPPPRTPASGSGGYPEIPPNFPTETEVAHARMLFGGSSKGTVAVGKTDVKGLEDQMFAGASPQARPKPLKSDQDRPIKAPYPKGGFADHAEEGVLNDFTHAANKLKRDAAARGEPEPKIKGTLFIRQDNTNGVCNKCTVGAKDPSKKTEGILVQFRKEFPDVEVVIVSNGPTTGKMGTPELILDQNGTFVAYDPR